jgi:multidrug transporter EmrE-like cation transporter
MKKRLFAILLIALLLCGGVCDVMSKAFETWGTAAQGNYFLVFTFGVALVLSIVACVVKKESITLPDVLWGLALGVPNYMSARFLLWALKEVPAVVVYPTFSVGTIIAVTVVGVLAFREKVGKRKLIALGMILGALVLLNV